MADRRSDGAPLAGTDLPGFADAPYAQLSALADDAGAA